MLILRTAAVIRLTGLSRTTLWRLERQGEFPAESAWGSTASAGKRRKSHAGLMRARAG